MKLIYTSIFIFLLAFGGCETNFTARVSKERSQNALNKWLRDYGLPDQNGGFDRGQEGSATVTDVYGYGSDPKTSYAKLEFKDFKYRDYERKVQSYTGKGVLTLRDVGNQQWTIGRLAFEDEHGAILKEFFPPEKIAVE